MQFAHLFVVTHRQWSNFFQDVFWRPCSACQRAYRCLLLPSSDRLPTPKESAFLWYSNTHLCDIRVLFATNGSHNKLDIVLIAYQIGHWKYAKRQKFTVGNNCPNNLLNVSSIYISRSSVFKKRKKKCKEPCNLLCKTNVLKMPWRRRKVTDALRLAMEG